MIDNGLILMVAGMGTVGAFLTTMIVAMHLTAAIINKWFPEKEKAKPGMAKTKATKSAAATPKAPTATSPTGKSEKKASADVEARNPSDRLVNAKAS